MCGILGISFSKGNTIDKHSMTKYILRTLLVESEIRGSDASGVAFIRKGGVAVLKDAVGARTFIGYDEFDDACKKYVNSETITILGHCRFKTKGTPRDKNNNHPIVTDNIVGVHNGIIYNDDFLFDKFQKESCWFKRSGKVDSEIIFRLIDHYVHIEGKSVVDAISETSSLLQGSFACAMVDKTRPYLLWLFRDTSPIAIYNYQESGVIVFASSSYFIDDAVNNMCKRVFGNPIKILLPISHCVGINLKTNLICRFGIETDERFLEGYNLTS